MRQKSTGYTNLVVYSIKAYPTININHRYLVARRTYLLSANYTETKEIGVAVSSKNHYSMGESIKGIEWRYEKEKRYVRDTATKMMKLPMWNKMISCFNKEAIPDAVKILEHNWRERKG